MSYYPLLKAPGCEGWTTLCNFPPNNWETIQTGPRFVNVTWSQGDCWRTETLCTLAPGEMKTVRGADTSAYVPEDRIAFLSLTVTKGERASASLPPLDLEKTIEPAWRASMGLATASASTSYQGEIDPFPVTASLLTFCPLIQFETDVRNYLLFVNLEKSPAVRVSRVEVYDAASAALHATFEVKSNDITFVPLDDVGLVPSELPLILCRNMAGIPLYFARTTDGAFLSLEHTHPPASFVIHGRRWEAQKVLKQRWFGRMGASS